MPQHRQPNRKRGTAVNGDCFELSHPELGLDEPFTSSTDVTFDGVVHQVLAMADGHGLNFATTTGEFTVAGLPGLIVESMDTVATQVAHRYQAIVEGPTGVLVSQSYDSAERAMALIAALNPISTPLGMAMGSSPEVETAGVTRVALNTAIGILELTPLTEAVANQLPDWAGTPVDHGELYGGQMSDGTAYLTLATPTARVVAMLGAETDPDHGASVLARLDARWHRR